MSDSPTAIPARSQAVISTTTYVVSSLLAILLASYYFLNAATYAERISGVPADFVYAFGIVLPSLASTIIIVVAFAIGVRESVGR